MQNRRRGFTLIELLVVIAIIAILAAILFPVYARLKEKAIRTLCLSNCKQLGTAFQSYVDDNDGRYPADGVYPEDYGWVISPQKEYNIQVEQGALFPYVRNRDLYICPLQRKKTVDIKLSYTMNGRLRLLSQSVIKAPSGCLVLIEEAEHTCGIDEGPNDGTYYDWYVGTAADRPAERHLGGGNHTFADGHAKWVPASKLITGNVNDRRFYDPSLVAPQL